MMKMKLNSTLVAVAVLALGAVGCTGQKPTKLTTVPGVKTIVQNPNPTGPVGPTTPTQPPPGTTLPPTQPPTTTTPVGPQNPVVVNPGPQDPMNFDFPTTFENAIADRNALFNLMVNFDYDSAAIRPVDMPKIEQVARHLVQNPNFLLQVEGHCDERGTEQYNLSLGERRALAVTEQIIRLGIAPDRIRTLSLGEEVPLVDSSSQDAYSQNRRGEFVLMVPRQ